MGRAQHAIGPGDDQIGLVSEPSGREQRRTHRDTARQPAGAALRPAGATSRETASLQPTGEIYQPH